MIRATWRPAHEVDRDFLFEAYKQALKEHVEWAWGWDEALQRDGFWRHHPFEHFRVIEVEAQRAGGIHVEVTNTRTLCGSYSYCRSSAEKG
jgi:hypothetical protein